MVRKKVKGKKMYYVQCGDWDGVTIAADPREACIEALSQSIEFFKTKAKMTKVIISLDCDSCMNSDEKNINESVNAYLVESLLEEIYEH